MKIGQYRRLHARAELEQLAAGHLLYQLDRRESAPDLQTLIESGYAPAPRHTPTETLAWDDGVAASPVWGTAARMVPLLVLISRSGNTSAPVCI
ncbi:MAG: hypothetical protein JJU05_16910 [Verrucomicrobia bacterium]|nr:hypothetical protein [Verrucomicrobiota bacterium]MCH8528804.1 hypothetical protein [Kiritimatiellia bacterium]